LGWCGMRTKREIEVEYKKVCERNYRSGGVSGVQEKDIFEWVLEIGRYAK